VDANDDGKCRDAYYRRRAVSQERGHLGHNGLHKSDSDPQSDLFELSGDVMVWSFGPDGSISDPPGKANLPPNQDNLLSWK
jgi:hypothetical protein